MQTLIRAAVQRSRASLLILVALWIGGYQAFLNLPKESNPDITVPFIYVSVSHEGIAPEDAERLIVRPLEQELRAISGLKEMTAVASEGHASVTLEFSPGVDPDDALADVRAKVDTAGGKLPEGSDEPSIHEVNVSQFPVLTLSLSGPVAEAQLIFLAREFKRQLESIPEVLAVEIGGDREDLLEIVVDPQVMEQYGISYAQLLGLIANNNRLVAAGHIDDGAGRLSVKVPGLIEDLPDLLSMPIKHIEGDVITFDDIAAIQQTFKSPNTIAEVNGQPAVVLEISKRAGSNILEAIGKVLYLTALSEDRLPEGVSITTLYDESGQIKDMLTDLLNNVAFAIVLVMIIVVGSMGLRPALLVGLTIPGAFLSSMLVIQAMGFTLNVVVLFSLILVAGMLVDGAIVVAEYAERELDAGAAPTEAYVRAAGRMAWPIIASTATTLAVFVPLLFWPGIVGEFMSYLPATVIVVLIASLMMSLIFLPVVGATITRRRMHTAHVPAFAENGVGKGAAVYQKLLRPCLQAPIKTLSLFFLILTACYVSYGKFNHGVEFFPDVEPEAVQLLLRARGDLSIHEKHQQMRLVQNRLQGFQEVESVYAKTLGTADEQLGPDVIGVITFQLKDWEERRPANRLLDDMRRQLADIPLQYEFQKKEDGPSEGKPIAIRVSGELVDLEPAVEDLRKILQGIEGITALSDNRSLPGVEWRIQVERDKAASYGVDITTLGNVIQLATGGLELADYRPDYVDEEVDIRLRLPREQRHLDNLINQSVNTESGPVPMAHFAQLVAAPKTGSIHRLNSQRTLTVEADVLEGYQADQLLSIIRSTLETAPLEKVEVSFGGEEEEQQETMAFLGGAFLVAVVAMAVILVIQFNSLYQALLVLSAIVFSTGGVLLGLLITGQAFGVVMVGLGLIALAGIVVNNNIILIDTYNELKVRFDDPIQAALKTGALRLRPVLLTATTTVLGLMPMVLGVNVDLITPALSLGAPSTQWWTQLSSAIAGGLTFATVLTLFITPCLLVLRDKLQRGSAKS